MKFENPPAAPGGDRPSWAARLAPLQERPGEWACIGDFAPPTASHLRSGLYRRPSGVWEFRSRTLNAAGEKPRPGKLWLYAQYVGPESLSSAS